MTQDQTAPQPPSSRNRPGGGRRVLWVVLGIITIVVLLLGAARWMASAAQETTSEEETFPADDIDALEVDGEAGDMRIVVEERDDVAVVTRLTSGLWDRATSDAQVSGGTLSLDTDCDRAALFSRCQVEYDIALPGDAIERMRVTAAAGGVQIDEFSGEVEVETTAGRIDLSGFAGDTARLETTAGRITVDAEAAPRTLEAMTSAGEITITVPDEIYRVSTATSVGDVDVSVREDPDAERFISARATAGAITIQPR